MAELTPMMKQYLEIKEQNKDSILFFRLGDFYEMFGDDARTASAELDLALTSRDKGKSKSEEERTPMCGVPYHSSDAYIARLIAKGYKVAICEQTEDPAQAKGLVKRDIIRVVTPGTAMECGGQDERGTNFLCAIYLDAQGAGICFCELSTGKTHATAFQGEDCVDALCNELGRFAPSEVILSREASQCQRLMQALREKLSCLIEPAPQRFDWERAQKTVRRQFGDASFSQIPQGEASAVLALGGLLEYLFETQKTDLSYVRELDYYRQGCFMELDWTARRNLELTETLRGKEKRGSLLWVLDRTKTAMGGRLLRSWLDQPLLCVAEIRRRSGAVAALVGDTLLREELTLALQGIHDMERLIGRIVYGSAGGRDLVSLSSSAERLPRVKELLSGFADGRLAELCAELDCLCDLTEQVTATLVEAPPFSVREGGLIREGFSEEVDKLRDTKNGGKSLIADIEARERERTGIRTLKTGFNKVFGYYIEVSKSYAEQVPDDYIRKQTLVGGERYITPELKELEQTVLTAGDRCNALEYEIFNRLRLDLVEMGARVQRSASVIAELDVYLSLADVAVRQRYCRPEVDESGELDIRDGRHPVVEQMRKDSLFVPNDTHMNTAQERVAILTGPNMAGKSTYMRQVALIVLLAQIGSFVPARSAHIGIVDRIFTRIGASDDLAAGQSTFMVEMTEVAQLLQAATPRSLLILDEIGRGTSTFDGMSIARAVLEYCADPKKLGAKTLFATHYHELTVLEQTLPGVKNYNVAVKTRGEEIVFLRKILEGGADRSYGIEVAKLAGLPETVLRRARSILRELERSGRTAPEIAPETAAEPERDPQLSFARLGEAEVLDTLRRCAPETMTPLEAMSLLYQLKQKLQ